jgi:hypothetical protein
MKRFAFLVCLTGVAVACAFVFAACAAGHAPSKVSAPSKPGPDAVPPTQTDPLLGGRPDEIRDRIRELDEAIQRELGEGGMEPPDAAATAQMSDTPMAEVRLTCEHVPSDRCNDVCKLSDSICSNATSICELADQLPGDAWAAERCGAAKASCQRATQRCCGGECAATP